MGFTQAMASRLSKWHWVKPLHFFFFFLFVLNQERNLNTKKSSNTAQNKMSKSKRQTHYFEGSQPEWCISSMIYIEIHHSGQNPSILSLPQVNTSSKSSCFVQNTICSLYHCMYISICMQSAQTWPHVTRNPQC